MNAKAIAGLSQLSQTNPDIIPTQGMLKRGLKPISKWQAQMGQILRPHVLPPKGERAQYSTKLQFPSARGTGWRLLPLLPPRNPLCAVYV